MTLQQDGWAQRSRVGEFLSILEDTMLEMGPHEPEDGKACLMEKVAILWALRTGQDVADLFDDLPACTNEVIARAAQVVNDLLDDVERQVLNGFIPRLLRARRTESDQRVNTRLAIWTAREVLDLVDDQHRSLAYEAIEAAQAWLEEPVVAAQERARDAWIAIDEAVGVALLADPDVAAADVAPYPPHEWQSSLSAAGWAAAWAADVGRERLSDAAMALDTSGGDLVRFLDELLDQWELAVTKEGEDLYVSEEWEDEALAFIAEWQAEQAGQSAALAST